MGAPRKQNVFKFTDDYIIVVSSNSNDEFYIDYQDYDIVKAYCWRVQIDKRSGYKRVVTSIHYLDGTCKIKTIWSLITGWEYVDHNDGNTLNNRRNNLRESMHLLNMQNKKAYKNNKTGHQGIRIVKNKYYVGIRYDNKEYNLGTYNDFNAALMVRVRAEAAIFNKEYAPHRDLFNKYNIDIEYEKKYWNWWINTDGINYLGDPIHPQQKKIVQLTQSNEYMQCFKSITEASKITGVNRSSIGLCCNHRYLSAGGFIWMFKNEYDSLKHNDIKDETKLEDEI